MNDFVLLFLAIVLFLLPYTYKALLAEMCRIGDFKGWVTSIARFRWKGRRSPNSVGWQKTRRIALSRGTKISPVDSLD